MDTAHPALAMKLSCRLSTSRSDSDCLHSNIFTSRASAGAARALVCFAGSALGESLLFQHINRIRYE
eukprot:257091-Pleurochrysis_carterae.AAC.4